jgi:hypothetical protein
MNGPERKIRKPRGDNLNLKKEIKGIMVTEIAMNIKFYSFKPFALWLRDPNKMFEEQLDRSGVMWRAGTEVVKSKPENWELDLRTVVVNEDGEKTSEEVLMDLSDYMFSTDYKVKMEVTAEREG